MSWTKKKCFDFVWILKSSFFFVGMFAERDKKTKIPLTFICVRSKRMKTERERAREIEEEKKRHTYTKNKLEIRGRWDAQVVWLAIFEIILSFVMFILAAWWTYIQWPKIDDFGATNWKWTGAFLAASLYLRSEHWTLLAHSERRRIFRRPMHELKETILRYAFVLRCVFFFSAITAGHIHKHVPLLIFSNTRSMRGRFAFYWFCCFFNFSFHFYSNANSHGAESWRSCYDINITNSISRLIEYSQTRCAVLCVCFFFRLLCSWSNCMPYWPHIHFCRKHLILFIFCAEFPNWRYAFHFVVFFFLSTKYQYLSNCKKKNNHAYTNDIISAEIVSSGQQSGIPTNRKIKSFYENNDSICSNGVVVFFCLPKKEMKNRSIHWWPNSKINTRSIQTMLPNLVNTFFVRQTIERSFQFDVFLVKKILLLFFFYSICGSHKEKREFI